MTGGIRRFIKVDYPRTDIGIQVAFERRTTHWYRSEMSRTNEKSVVVLEEQWPFARVNDGSGSFWFDSIVELLAFGKHNRHFGKGRSQARTTAQGLFLLLGLLEWSNIEILFLLKLWVAELVCNFCAGRPI